MNQHFVSPSLQALLDQPVWSALDGGHRHLALGGQLARRYPREIGPFAALADGTSTDAIVALPAGSLVSRTVEARLWRDEQAPGIESGGLHAASVRARLHSPSA